MYSFLFTYTLDSENARNAFLEELMKNDIPSLCSKEKGCIMYKYFLPVGEPEKLCIVESWTDKNAQTIHCSQPHCGIIRTLKEKYGVKSDSVCLSSEE